MVKKSKVQKHNAATDMAKSPINDSELRVSNLTLTKKPSNSKIVCVRRSGRIKSSIRPAQNQEIEEINLVESEREEDEPHVERPLIESEPCNDDSLIEPTPIQKTLDEKVDDLIKAVEELKSKGAKGHVSCEDTSVNFDYKRLYFASQKKIEALTSNNHDIAKKLEIAQGKLEVYENINKSNEAVIISNLTKATEAVVGLASHVVDRFSCPGGSALPDGGGSGGDGQPKKSSAKKRRRDETSK